ncbi:hypothetical protein NDU88_000844 [Pleurodeles waltl]|uniref:Uncharacterized protein n=1 Tax=Pleurodeles waltl TaxID=8319 RepID=A0AAV7Q4A3_PLEWA|nr:hypothetical protein NDU88_000844 [Pleurodeles waltl]
METTASPVARTTDVRVLTETKREDGLQGGVEEDAEETDSEEDAERQGDREEQEDADWRHWNSGGQRRVTDHGRKEESGDALTARHTRGGTWLTKIQRCTSTAVTAVAAVVAVTAEPTRHW